MGFYTPGFYTSKQVREILGLSPAIVARLIEAGFVNPERGPRRELRFSFQDLVVLRAAKGLADARLPARRISASLKKLRQQLPAELPSKGLRIAAIGNSVAVLEGRDTWRAADGQYLLAFEVTAPEGHVVILEKKEGGKTAEQWFDEGCRLEENDAVKALRHYRSAVSSRVHHAGIYTNLALLLHQAGDFDEAEATYREGIRQFPEDSVLLFNFGVLFDDQGKLEEAIACYHEALEKDPEFGDACYNLALLYEATGRKRDAVRYFNAFRKLNGKT
jgi:tetratricopeptide (TPR) repeat protein